LFTPLVNFARKYIPDCHTAEDIVQEVFLKFLRLPNKPGDEAWIKSYLHVMTRNACFTRMRAAPVSSNINIEKHIETLPQPDGDHALIYENSLIQYALNERARKEIEQMPGQCGQVMKRFYLEEKSYAEIAEQLSISVDNARHQVSIGTKKLQVTLGKFKKLYKASNAMIFILLSWLLAVCISRLLHFF